MATLCSNAPSREFDVICRRDKRGINAEMTIDTVYSPTRIVSVFDDYRQNFYPR